MTWRQKDRESSQLGVYGKAKFNDTQDQKEAQTQHQLADYNRNGTRTNRNRRRYGKSSVNRQDNEATTVEPSAISQQKQQTINVDDGKHTTHKSRCISRKIKAAIKSRKELKRKEEINFYIYNCICNLIDFVLL